MFLPIGVEMQCCLDTVTCRNKDPMNKPIFYCQIWLDLVNEICPVSIIGRWSQLISLVKLLVFDEHFFLTFFPICFFMSFLYIVLVHSQTLPQLEVPLQLIRKEVGFRAKDAHWDEDSMLPQPLDIFWRWDCFHPQVPYRYLILVPLRNRTYIFSQRVSIIKHLRLKSPVYFNPLNAASCMLVIIVGINLRDGIVVAHCLKMCACKQTKQTTQWRNINVLTLNLNYSK